MMQLGVDGVFVGSGIFKSQDPATMARAIVEATTHFEDPDVLAKVSHGLGDPDGRARDRHARDAPAGPRLVAANARWASVKAGVLALQGDFREHAAHARHAGATPGRGPHRRATWPASTAW